MRRNMCKRIGALAACLALCLGLLFPAVPAARAAENSPRTLYISTAAELALLSKDCTLDAYSRNLTVVLTADIDLSDVEFAPIPVFCGDFNGAGHTVSGFSFTEKGSDQGFIRYLQAGAVVRDLTDPRVAPLVTALTHLKGEAHQLQGFLRFSEQGGVLTAEIEPKNRVLPLLRPHFCARYSGERFVIYDRTHREALFYQPGRWAIVPLEAFCAGVPGETELDYRRLWRRFYDTISIEGRYHPKCRMTHMPKRYWNTMTEFQTEPGLRER